MQQKKPNRRSIPVTVTIRREILETIDSLADAQNLTRSQFIERQVINGIEQEKATVALLSNPSMATALANLFATPEALQTMSKAMKQEVSEKQLEIFSRGIQLASEQAVETLAPKRKGKGKTS